jgi:hypothetical protein
MTSLNKKGISGVAPKASCKLLIPPDRQIVPPMAFIYGVMTVL